MTEAEEVKSEEKPKERCIDPIAKVQARNVLVSWYNKRKEEIAKMEEEGVVSPEWIKNYSTVLESVEAEITRLDDTPDCIEGEPVEEEATA